MTEIIPIDKFDYVVLDCGYGSRINEKYENGEYDFNETGVFNDDDVKIVAVHGCSFDYEQELRSPVEVRNDEIHDPVHMDIVTDILGEAFFSHIHGSITLRLDENSCRGKKIDWMLINKLVNYFGVEKEFCAFFDMGNMYKTTMYKNGDVRILVCTFDTESG